MNAFALGTLFSAVLCILFGALVYQRDVRNRVNKAFMLLCMGCAYWAFIEFGFCQARNLEEAWIWRKLFSAWPFPCVAFIAFTLVFTERAHLLRSKWSWLILYGPAVAFAISDLMTTRISGPPVQMYWGWTYDSPEQNLLGTVAMLWQFCFCVLPVYFVGRYYMVVINEQKRKQARLFLFGMIVAIIGILIEWSLYLLHIRIPPVGAISIVATCFFVGYAMWKHSLFTLTPVTAAENIVSTMTDALLLVGMEGKIISSNNAALALLGYSRNDLEALTVDAVFPGADAKPEWLLNKGIDETEHPVKFEVVETLLLTRNGTKIPVSLAGSVLTDEDGARQGLLLIARDIKLRKNAEAALEESERQYRLLVGSITDVFWTMNTDLEVIYISPSIERQRGFTVEEFRNLEFEETLTPESVEIARREVATAYAEEDASPASIRQPRVIELEAKCKNGSTCWIESTVSPIRDEHGQLNGIAGVSRDITKRKHTQMEKDLLEEQFIQSQKMEAIGRLAGGVAHDMNNVLAAIMGSASLLVTETGLEEQQREDVETILAACNRGRGLTQDLLGFARKGKYVKETVSLNKVVGRVKDLLDRTISKKITVEMLLDESLHGIEGDSAQLEHALMNVCINAADAMQSGGTLTIKTSNAHSLESPEVSGSGLGPGDYVELKVSDTGVGIDQECIKLVFEPFFTTKPKGKGTGLGLSMVYGAVINHGGAVNIESTPGEGTTVAILIPALDIQMKASSSEIPAEAPFPEPTDETILVIDDEVLIRNVARRLLTNLGYSVLLADGGRTAMQLYKENRDLISLVILDMIMPDMDGTDTFYALKDHNPEVKIILCSGYSKDERVNRLLADGAAGFVPKPFSYGTLAQEITSTLD
ncbi:MAG: PAS domain S-box protein [Deltaproteobacteria bacterium]|nr:PAS domain S-box protein [Deltaproteobacteria bacterium]